MINDLFSTLFISVLTGCWTTHIPSKLKWFLNTWPHFKDYHLYFGPWTMMSQIPCHNREEACLFAWTWPLDVSLELSFVNLSICHTLKRYPTIPASLDSSWKKIVCCKWKLPWFFFPYEMRGWNPKSLQNMGIIQNRLGKTSMLAISGCSKGKENAKSLPNRLGKTCLQASSRYVRCMQEVIWAQQVSITCNYFFLFCSAFILLILTFDWFFSIILFYWLNFIIVFLNTNMKTRDLRLFISYL